MLYEGRCIEASYISHPGEERGGRDQRSRLESRGLDEDEKEVVSCGSCEGKELVGVGNRRLWLLRRLTHACMPPTITVHAMEPQSKFRNIYSNVLNSTSVSLVSCVWLIFVLVYVPTRSAVHLVATGCQYSLHIQCLGDPPPLHLHPLPDCRQLVLLADGGLLGWPGVRPGPDHLQTSGHVPRQWVLG